MGRIALLIIVLVVIAFPALARDLEIERIQFPSDGEDPKTSGGAELLEAVCPGKVVAGEKMECNIKCPAFTGFNLEDLKGWRLERITRGHFRSATSDDALLWMTGCEPHSRQWGGTVLMTRTAGRWKMIYYRSGMVTHACHKLVLVSGREILVCTDVDGGQGSLWRTLYLLDVLAPAEEPHPFFTAYDDTRTCGGDDKLGPIVHGYIENVEIRPVAQSALPSLVVTAGTGTKELTLLEWKACRKDQGSTLPPAKEYELHFHFDGKTYRPGAKSRETVKLFGRQ